MRNIQSLLNVKSIGSRRTGGGGIIYILKDTFTTAAAAGSVNGTTADTGQTRTVTDVNSKLSISSGIMTWATGAGATNDGLWYPALTRTAGRLMLATVTPGNNSAIVPVGWDDNQAGIPTDVIRFNSGGVNAISIIANGTSGVVVGTETTSVAYQVCVILRANGSFYFIKGGTEYPNWTLLWHFPTKNTTPMYPFIGPFNATAPFTADNIRIPSNLYLPTPLAYDTFTRSNGAIGSTETAGPDSQNTPSLAWVGSTYSISGNSAICTPVTLGTELVSNGSFTTDTTGWAAGNATLTSVAGGQSGNCMQIQNTSAAFGTAKQTVTTIANTWYVFSVYVKNGTVQDAFRLGSANDGTQYAANNVGGAASWSKVTRTFLATSTTTFIRFGPSTAVLNDTSLVDEVSVKALTISELFASLSTSTKDVIADINIILSQQQNVAGVVINLDSTSNPQNFVLAYTDRTNAFLVKCVAGVYTTVISAAITYSAGATLRVIKDGTSYQLFYNNLKVGSTSTISDAGIISNTTHGLFASNTDNSTDITLDNFQLFPRGSTNNEYAALESY